MRVVHLIPELRDDMPSLALTSELARSRVHASQAEVTALLTSLLAVALHLPTLACIAGLGDSLLN